MNAKHSPGAKDTNERYTPESKFAAPLIAGNIIKDSRGTGLLRRRIAIGYAASLRFRDLFTRYFPEPFHRGKKGCKCFNQSNHKSRF